MNVNVSTVATDTEHKPSPQKKKKTTKPDSFNFLCYFQEKKKIVTTNNLLSCNSSIYISYLADETFCLSLLSLTHQSAINSSSHSEADKKRKCHKIHSMQEMNDSFKL